LEESPIDVTEVPTDCGNNKNNKFNKILKKGGLFMKKFIAVTLAVCQIYTSVVDFVNNVVVILENVQSVLVRANGASVTSSGYGSFE
jgi:hypothetical protein